MDKSAKVTKAKAQPSRKGKRAWRKNIDVDDVSEALDAKRDKEILHGKDDNDGFVIDTEGSVSKKEQVKKLKMLDILTNKSKVEPVKGRSMKKHVSSSKVKELMALAGRSKTERSDQRRLEKEGLIKGENVDVWADVEEPAIPDVLKKSAYTSVTKPTKLPKTIQQAPIKLTLDKHKGEVEDAVHAGKSYNPSLESWQALIDKEFDAESSIEIKRQAMEEHAQRIQYLIENMKEDTFETDDEEEEEKLEDEEKTAEVKEGNHGLSINAPAKWNKKSKAERGRMARNKERRELEDRLRDLKKRMKELNNLEEIEKEVEKKQEAVSQKQPKVKKHYRHGRNDVVFKPLEVKLSDELTGNLKNLKPEGNLIYEQMHKLQATGKIEGFGLRRKRRYTPKIVEKYSYKRFK